MTLFLILLRKIDTMRTEFLYAPTTELSTACTSVYTLWGLLLMVMTLPLLCLGSALDPPLCPLKGFAPTAGFALVPSPFPFYMVLPSNIKTLHFLHLLKKKTDRRSLMSSYLSPAILLCGFIITPCSQRLLFSPLFLDRKCPQPPPSQCQFSVLRPLASQQHLAQLMPLPSSHILSSGLEDPTF